MRNTPTQLVFKALGLTRFEFKESSQIAYQGEDGPFLPQEKELVKAQLVVELIDRYHYSPESISINALITLRGPQLHYVEADILVQKWVHRFYPYILFVVESPKFYEEKKEENLRKLFEMGTAFPGNTKPSFLAYYTRWHKEKTITKSFLVIDFKKYQNFSAWQKIKRPHLKDIPKNLQPWKQ